MNPTPSSPSPSGVASAPCSSAASAVSLAPATAPADDLAGPLMSFLEQGGRLGQLLQLRPEQLDLIYSAAHQLYAQGRHQEALKAFGVLAGLNPSQGRFHHAVATCLQRLGRYRDASMCYLFLQVIEPDGVEPLFRLAECALAEGEAESAIGLLESVVNLPGAGESDASWKTRSQALLTLLREGHADANGVGTPERALTPEPTPSGVSS